MMAKMMILVCVTGMAVSAFGQTTQPVTGTKFPYQGVVKGTDVHVRSGPGMRHYRCTKVDRPSRVTVVGKKDKWLEILPVDKCFSVVFKGHVTVDATGKIGTITGKRVAIRPGGNLRRTD